MSVLGPITSPQRLPGRSAARLIAVILQARLRGFLNSMRNTRLGRTRVVITIIAGFLAALGIGFLVNRFTVGMSALTPEMLAEIEPSGIEFGFDPATLLGLVPRIVFTSSLAMLLFATFASLLGALYLGKDMPRLLTSPAPARVVFLAKFVEAAVQPTVLLAIFGLPALVGYGLATNAGALYHFATILLFLLLPPAALGVSSLATLALVRVLPARRANEALRVLGAFAGIGVYFGSQTMLRDDPMSMMRSLSRAPGLLGAGEGKALVLPWAWPAESVLAAAGGRPLAALGWGLGFAALSLGIVAIAALASERLYLDGWAKAEGDGASRRRGRDRPTGDGERAGRLAGWRNAALRSPALSIARKDLRLIRRDVRGWSMIIWPVAIGIFWLWRTATVGGDELIDGGQNMLRAASIAATLFSAGAVGQRLAIEGISRDAASAYIALGAPVSGRQIVAGKIIVAFVPALAASIVLLTGFALITRLSPATALLDASLVLIALAGQVAIGVAAGSVRPVFDWTDPQKIMSGGIGCLTWIAVLAFSFLIVGIGLGPAIATQILGAPEWLGLLGPLVALFLTAVVIAGCVAWASQRVGTIEM